MQDTNNKTRMSKEDMRKVIKWFEEEILLLESLPVYPEIRERVEGLKEKVDGFKEGLNDHADIVLQGYMEEAG